MENEKVKALVMKLATMPRELQDRGVGYIMGLVDGHEIREAMEKKKKKETEEREGA